MISLEKISKHYQSKSSQKGNIVLDEISLSINKNDSIAIVGPSGSGKSTLLNILGTLDVPSNGSMKFQDAAVDLLDDKELSLLRNQKVGFIFQMHHLLPQLNVLENVLLPVIPNASKKEKKDAMNRAMKLLKQVGLEDHIHKFPTQLSGGECQRVTVVRAMINKPDIILADEPTGSLDQNSAAQVGDLLIELQEEQKIALVVVTHSLELANKMKIKYRLEKGKLIQFN